MKAYAEFFAFFTKFTNSFNGIEEQASWPSIAIGNALFPYVAYNFLTTNFATARVFDPFIITASATAITDTAATLGGELLASVTPALGTVTERGIVYATTANPTTAVTTKVIDGATTTGVFTGSISGLTAATDYYARAYFIYTDATTSVVTTVYGSNKKFTTAAALGTDSFEKSDLVKAYPNPTTDIVAVSLPGTAVVEKIAVYNSLGQLVLAEAKNTVSLQHLAKGNYYLAIYTSEGNFAKKIIKE